MKRKSLFTMSLAIIVLAVIVSSLFIGCSKTVVSSQTSASVPAPSELTDDSAAEASDSDDDYTYVSDLETSLTISCVSGTTNIATQTTNADGSITITFGTISQDTEYNISGTLNGNIVIDVDSTETYDFELNLSGLTLQSESEVPIYIESGANVQISAKKDTENYIYDARAEVTSTNGISAAIYSLVDLDIGGKGALWVYSANNNGIHSKDDLKVKNLTLYVQCEDNALKGNDSVTISSGTITLIARSGDGIKTTNSSISSKGNQKGNIIIASGTLTVYAACDGIDAAYNVVVEKSDETADNPIIYVYTDKYSPYSTDVTYASTNGIYLRATSTTYKYSVLYTNSSTGATAWVNTSSYTAVSASSGGAGFDGGRGRSSSTTTYYYYSIDLPSGYDKMTIYAYSSSQTQGQSDSYVAKSSQISVNSSYDTIAMTISSSTVSTSWTNYTTASAQMGGGFGMNDGNTDKGDYSTKGFKAANAISITTGTIIIKAYDDAIHANTDSTLENSETPLGNVTISGGSVSVHSNDDGIHADGTLTISGGNVIVATSYEGLEGKYVVISGGTTAVAASDDGLNATASSGAGITINDGYLYVYSGGDGLDSNSSTSYGAMIFNGGNVVVISTSSGNSCLDSDGGYKYNGGRIIAMCPTGMTQECQNCSNFSSVAITKTGSISGYVTVGSEVAIKMPVSISNGYIVYLSGSSSKTISISSSSSAEFDTNGVYWS